MKKPVTLLVLFLFALTQIWAQQKTITGTVTSADDGQSLPGVNVVVLGTTVGTITDVDGVYHLTVPADATTLEFKFVGMKTYQVDIGDKTTIDVSMEQDVLGISEVIVTGLGTSRTKKALGYSVQDVKGDDLATAIEPNVVNSLQGRLSGVQISNSSGSVTSGARVVIRGMSTLTGNNQPLWVVDGVPIMNTYTSSGAYGDVDYGNAASDINPSDIESISVLKGANAAALYGSRAVNGVILVTTKSGKLRPGLKKGLGVTLESNFMWSNPLLLPEYQNLYGQGSGGEFAYVDGNYGGTNDGVDESWGPPLDQGLMIPQFDSPYDPVTGVRTPTPWISHPNNVKDVFVTGLNATNTLSLQGSDEKADFRLSFSNQKVTGIVPNTDLAKNNVTLSAGLNVTEKIRVSGNFSYINNKSGNIMRGGYSGGNILQSLSQWFGRQVDTKVLKDRWEETDPVTGLPFNWNHSYHNNPYFVLNKATHSRDRNRMLGNINLSWDFTPFLSFKGMVGNDYYSEARENRRPMGWVGDPLGGFDTNLTSRNQLDARGTLNFNKTFGDLSVLATAGGEYTHYNYLYHSTNVPDLIVPDLYSVSNSAAAATTGLSERHTELQSIFGQVNIGFKNYLFLDLTGRNDWSSTLPLDNNSYFYPSASLGFVVTEALGIQSTALSYLKLRASYAEVGGTADAYALQGTYNAGEPFNGNPSLTYTNTMPPVGLLPQAKKSIELGFESKFLQNRVGLDFTYYKENTINQIMSIDVSRTTGFNTQTINAGNLQNIGTEITLWATPVKSKDFSWNLSVNWSKNDNKVVELYGDMKDMTLFYMSWGTYAKARLGEPYGQIMAYDFVRENATTHYKDADNTVVDYIEYSGRPVVSTSGNYIKTPYRTLKGNVMPDWFGGVNNAFNFKGVNFSFLIDFRKGGQQFSVTDWFGHYAGVLAGTAGINPNGKNVREDVANGGGVLVEDAVYGRLDTDGNVVYTDATGADVSAPVSNTSYVNAEDFYHNYWGKPALSIFDASFVKLREVILGYTFHNVTPWISGINASIVGRNLWLIHSNIPDVDPENAFSAGNTQGVNSNPIPSTRTMGFNLRVTF
ncbi:MAG: SusC/RagA family TonB-linked outer membrane protein [Chlorobi bacterium]|nr:SusC/RagA family TonB-linked outer membrane protein [Chlorobiota bacterium]